MPRGVKRAATPHTRGPEAASPESRMAQYDACESTDHPSGLPEEELRRSRLDGVVRCLRCREEQRRKLRVVGTRGLDLTAHFRRRGRPSIEVVPSSPEADELDRFIDAYVETRMAAELVKPPTCAERVQKLRTPLDDSPVSTDVPSESSDSVPKNLPHVLHIGCDVCPRWYVVDHLLFEHWRDSRFTCCMIGERCGRKEVKTTLVSVSGSPGMLSRLGRPCVTRSCRPQVLPLGFWDLWRRNTALSAAAPLVFAAPVHTAGPSKCEEAEHLLFAAFNDPASQQTISQMFGRSRRRKKGANGDAKVWLLWQESAPTSSKPGKMVVAALVSWQRYTTKGPRELQGGVVLEYIVALPGKVGGAKAYYLVLAAEEVALLLGHSELFSACDLNQDGSAFNGRATPALKAHERWGFQDTNQKEWRDRRLETYDHDCCVHYMVKTVRSVHCA